jgi:hypothetical protein
LRQNVQELPFADGSFDCAVAAWMIYYVLLVGRDRSSEDVRFFAENGEEPLRRHFDSVERRDVIGEMSFTREAVRDYVANSIGHAHLVDSIPEFDEPLGVTRHTTIFVATK